jgi:CDP-paratose 2-epimerase
MGQTFLVTGGAGFIGSNLVTSLLRDGHHVTVLDSLARRGSKQNLAWLRSQNFDGLFRFIHGDIRSAEDVRAAAEDADVIYHVAGQVAVTTSVDDPRTDFEVNALGTLNILEGARLSGRQPVVVFTSTNKVYGGMAELAVTEGTRSYAYRDTSYGIPETQPLDFHSPYGCSKGAGDQYVRDYSRIYGLPAVVFRMSCIYGPRQFGTEDQGWLAHFMIATVKGETITIYGNGKQVRDVLFVDDLVRAFKLAREHIKTTAGQVYNIGGGAGNALAVWSEFGELLTALNGGDVPVRYGEWRPGDQPCYISDIRKAYAHMGWAPEIDKLTGIKRLWEWVCSNRSLFTKPAAVESRQATAGAKAV